MRRNCQLPSISSRSRQLAARVRSDQHLNSRRGLAEGKGGGQWHGEVAGGSEVDDPSTGSGTKRSAVRVVRTQEAHTIFGTAERSDGYQPTRIFQEGPRDVDGFVGPHGVERNGYTFRGSLTDPLLQARPVGHRHASELPDQFEVVLCGRSDHPCPRETQLLDQAHAYRTGAPWTRTVSPGLTGAAAMSSAAVVPTSRRFAAWRNSAFRFGEDVGCGHGYRR